MRRVRKFSKRYVKRAVIYFLMYCMLFNTSLPVVLATPGGYDVQYGNVTVHYNGNNTIVNITSNNAIINWASLNTLPHEVLQFLQQSSNSAVLNRIISGLPTQFDGTLLANGRVFIVNPAGVYFGNGAKINVNQLVASSLNISNADFLNGNYNFAGGSGSVINSGDITAEKVYLIGKQVANYGNIHCPAGYVVMASGDRVFLGEMGSDVVVEIDVPSLPELTEPIEGSAILNEGIVEVGDGKILLAAAGDIYSQAISNVGTLSASSDVTDAGQVELVATEGTIINSGLIDASGNNGGQVAMEGKRVGQFGTVQADGIQSDGGEIDLWASDVVALSSDSLTTANAGLNGDGGNVTVFSPDTALFWPDAQIEAKGGEVSGNGGFVEVSGKEHIEVFGLVDVSSNDGAPGLFFIDPHNITIQNAPGGSLDAGGNPFTATADGDTVSDDVIEGVINGGGDAVVQTSDGGLEDGDITQANDASIDFTGAGGAASLTINAADDIDLNGGITAAGAALTVTINASGNYDTSSTTGDVTINAAVGTNGGTFTSTGVSFDNTGGTITTSGGGITIDHTGAVTVAAALNSGAGAVDIDAAGASTIALNSTIDTTTGNVTIDSGGTTTVAVGGDITTTTGTVTFGGTLAGTLTTSGDVTTAGGAVTFTNATTLGGGITVDTGNAATGTISIAAITSGGNALILDSGSTAGATIDVTSMADISGGLTIRDAGGLATIGTIGNGTAGPVTITDSQAGVTFGGGVTATTLTITDTADGQAVTFNGDVTATTVNTAAQGYSVVFNEDATITNDLTFANTGGVTLGNGNDDILLFNGGLDTTAGATTARGAVRTSGDQMDIGALTISGGTLTLDTTNNGGTAAGAVLNVGAVTGGGNNLTINSGTGGAAAITSLTNIGTFTVTQSDSTTVAGATTATTMTLTDTDGAITFNGDVTATTVNTAAQGYSVVFNEDATITNDLTFANTGGVTLGDGDDDILLFNGGLDTTAGATTARGSVRTSGDQMDMGALTISGGTLTLDTTNNGGTPAGANIALNGTVDGTTALTEDLTLTAGTGDVTFAGTVGGVIPLGTVTVNSATNVYIRAAFNINSYILRGSVPGYAPIAPAVYFWLPSRVEVAGAGLEALLDWLTEKPEEEEEVQL